MYIIRGKGMVSSASILIGIIAGFVIAALALEMVRLWKNSRQLNWFAFPMPFQYGIDFVPGVLSY